MVIAGVLCLCAAAAFALSGLWSFTRTPGTDAVLALRRAQAPTQLAAGVMLTGGGAVALAAPRSALMVVGICAAGAVGTVAVGSWQSARDVLRRQVAAPQCGGSCAGCIRPCP